jgi:hypothetical protein
VTRDYFLPRLCCYAAFGISAIGLLVGTSLRAQPVATQQVPASADGATTPAGDLKIVAAVAFTNYDQLMKDVDFIGSLIGQPNLSAAVQQQLAMATGGKGLAGVDTAKPWGLILQTDGMQFLPIICLPVTNADEVLATLGTIGGEVKDVADGLKQVTLPNGKSAYIKNTGGWSFMSQNQASLARVPSNPEAAFSTVLKDYDIAARARAQNVPQMYRQMGILALQAAMQQQLLRQPGESDEEFATRRKSVQDQMQQTVEQLQQLDTLSVGVSVDDSKKNSQLEFTYTVVPDGTLAKQFAAYKEPQTNFAGFRQPDAAATFELVAKADPQAIQKDLAQFEALINGARAKFDKSVDEQGGDLDDAKRDAIKAAAGEWFDALEATLKSGQFDGAASLNVTPDSLTWVGGALVLDPSKVEAGLKKLDEQFKSSSKFAGVQWNADNHEGINFHTMSIPLPPSAEGPAKLLGDRADVTVGIGPQAVYLGVGQDNMQALKQAIDTSKAEPNKTTPPFEVTVAIAPLLEVAAQAEDGPERAKLQAAADMLRKTSPGRDHIRVVGQMIPNGLRYRIEAEDGAMKAILMKAIEAKQKAAAGAAEQGFGNNF